MAAPGPSEAVAPSAGASASGAPGPILRTVGGPLVLYHLLILLGAYFLVVGIVQSSSVSELLGGVLVGAGVAVEVGILAWSAGLVRRAAGGDTPTARRPADHRCLRCGWRGSSRATVCPRCGAVTVPDRNPRAPAG